MYVFGIIQNANFCLDTMLFYSFNMPISLYLMSVYYFLFSFPRQLEPLLGRETINDVNSLTLQKLRFVTVMQVQ